MLLLNKRLLSALFLPLLLTACDNTVPAKTELSNTPSDMPAASASQASAAPEAIQASLAPDDRNASADNSRNALDWQGNYEGVVPCASCEGIKTQLRIASNGTYLLKTQYLGEKGEEAKVFEERGQFQWNEAGSAIKLENGNWYRVGENQLTMLDREGHAITGAIADHYRLKRSN